MMQVRKVTILLLGDPHDPTGSQMIAESDPDMTPEQWVALGAQIQESFGKGDINQFLIKEDADGKTTATKVTGRIHEGPDTEH